MTSAKAIGIACLLGITIVASVVGVWPRTTGSPMLGGMAGAVGLTPPDGNPTCWAANESQNTPCAEEDNVNIPLYHSTIKEFQITATHPTYDVGEDNCSPDFTGCGGGAPGNAGGNVCQLLLDDGINAINVCTVQSWWRGDVMMEVSAEGNTLAGHFIQWHRKVEDEPSWPQYLVLFQDGNLRLKPHPPEGVEDVCFGSSVVVGPVTQGERPFVDIAAVSIDAGDQSLDIVYSAGGSAHVETSVDRTSAVADVMIDYDVAKNPFATFRSMFVADGNSDADRVEVEAGAQPILGEWTSLPGPWWWFYREVRSTHNTSAPDTRIEVTGANDTPTPTNTSTPEPAPTMTLTPQPTPTATFTPEPTFTPTSQPPTPTSTPTEPIVLPGDVQCDLRVDAIDAAHLLQFLASLVDELPCEANADANGDAEIDAIDAAVILQFSAGLVTQLPPPTITILEPRPNQRLPLITTVEFESQKFAYVLVRPDPLEPGQDYWLQPAAQLQPGTNLWVSDPVVIGQEADPSGFPFRVCVVITNRDLSAVQRLSRLPAGISRCVDVSRQ